MAGEITNFIDPYNLRQNNAIWGSLSPQDSTTELALACNAHDTCYQTCNNDKGECDAKLEEGIVNSCDDAYPLPCPLEASQCIAYMAQRFGCTQIANVFGKGVEAFGKGAYEGRQVEYCSCCEP